jgi:hypothetical protein
MAKLKVNSTYFFIKYKTICTLISLDKNTALFDKPISSRDICIGGGYPYFPFAFSDYAFIEITDSNKELVNILYS